MKLRILWVIAAGLLMSCGKKDSDILAVIGDQDTIRVQELKWVLAQQTNQPFSEVSFEEKRESLDDLIGERLFFIAARENKTDEKELYTKFDRAKEVLIKKASFDKYLYPHFINQLTLANYRRFNGVDARVQNIIIGFKTFESKYTKTKERAKALADSVRRIITNQNFTDLMELFSDNMDPVAQKVNLHPVVLRFGDQPFEYDQLVFTNPPNTIVGPIELPNMFVFTKIMGLEYTHYQDLSNVSDVTLIGRIRVKLDDSNTLLSYYTSSREAAMKSSHLKFNNFLINELVSKTINESRVSEIKNTFAKDLSASLINSDGIDLTLKEYFDFLGDDQRVPRSADLLKENLGDYFYRKHLANRLKHDGYFETPDFQFRVAQIFRRLTIQLFSNDSTVEPSVSDSALSVYAQEHLLEFEPPQEIKIQELFCKSKERLLYTESFIRRGIDLKKAAESSNNEIPLNVSPDMSKTEFKEYIIKTNLRDEVVHAATKLEVGDRSKIFARKDGGFSIIKILEKNKPSLNLKQSRALILKKYKEDIRNKMQANKILRLKKKFRVEILEKNL